MRAGQSAHGLWSRGLSDARLLVCARPALTRAHMAKVSPIAILERLRQDAEFVASGNIPQLENINNDYE
eukprot:5456418-Prymnesium_polylepis.1